MSLSNAFGCGTAGELARVFSGLTARVFVLGGWSDLSLRGLGTARHAFFGAELSSVVSLRGVDVSEFSRSCGWCGTR